MSTAVEETTIPHSSPNNGQQDLPLGDVMPSPFNPRKTFDDAELKDLAESIGRHGVLQPIVVRHATYPEADAPYEIIMGERRFRAAQIAGLTRIPIVVREQVDDPTLIELALEENLKRADLNPIEEAEGLKKLMELRGYTQTQLAEKLDSSQERISNTVRLLQLPQEVQEKIANRELTATHGVSILRHKEAGEEVMKAVADVAISKKLSTAEIEKGIPPETFSEMHKAGTARQINYLTKFDWRNVCIENCPFQAHQVDRFGQHWCLKPAEYDVKQQTALDAIAAQQQAALVEAGIEDADGLPRLEEMKGYTYPSNLVSGCTVECPCRVKALTTSSTVMEVCTDPKRFQELEKLDKEKIAEKRKAWANERFEGVQKLLAEVASLEDARRLLAMVVYMGIHEIDSGALQVTVKGYTDAAPLKDLAEGETWDAAVLVGHLDSLSAVDPLTLVKVYVEAMTRHELLVFAKSVGSARAESTMYSDWLLQDRSQEALSLEETAGREDGPIAPPKVASPNVGERVQWIDERDVCWSGVVAAVWEDRGGLNVQRVPLYPALPDYLVPNADGPEASDGLDELAHRNLMEEVEQENASDDVVEGNVCTPEAMAAAFTPTVPQGDAPEAVQPVDSAVSDEEWEASAKVEQVAEQPFDAVQRAPEAFVGQEQSSPQIPADRFGVGERIRAKHNGEWFIATHKSQFCDWDGLRGFMLRESNEHAEVWQSEKKPGTCWVITAAKKIPCQGYDRAMFEFQRITLTLAAPPVSPVQAEADQPVPAVQPPAQVDDEQRTQTQIPVETIVVDQDTFDLLSMCFEMHVETGQIDSGPCEVAGQSYVVVDVQGENGIENVRAVKVQQFEDTGEGSERVGKWIGSLLNHGKQQYRVISDPVEFVLAESP